MNSVIGIKFRKAKQSEKGFICFWLKNGGNDTACKRVRFGIILLMEVLKKSGDLLDNHP